MIDSINIPKIVKSQSTGNENTVVQAFSQNYWTRILPVQNSPFVWNAPVYNIEGATRNYYQIDYNGLSTDINNGKNITLVFTANTESISGLTMLNHKLYKIDFEDYVKAKNDINGSAFTQTILDNITNPIYTFSEVASGTTGVASLISGGRYTFTFPTKIKPTGQFTVDLFKDKSQYFVDSEFVFPASINTTIGDIVIYNNQNTEPTTQILDYYRNDYVLLTSNLGTHIIEGNTPFSGLSVTGAFFTYIVPPNKPNLYVSNGNSEIAVRDTLNTFAPTFNFSNVEDGDYYKLQVTYDPIDYQFQNTSVATFVINKQEGDAEFVRTFATPLTPGREFLYRIGNVKEVENIFGVKQGTVVYSDYVYAVTATDGRYVLSGTAYQDVISDATVLAGVTFELRGYYGSATVRKTIDIRNLNSLVDEVDSVIGSSQNSGAVLTTTSDANGNYSFGRIDGGSYVLTVIPPTSLAGAYYTNSYVININQDTDWDVLLTIIWGNRQITFSDPFVFV